MTIAAAMVSLILGVLIYISMVYALRMVQFREKRLTLLSIYRTLREPKHLQTWQKVLLLNSRKVQHSKKEKLFLGCGLPISFIRYEVLRRLLQLGSMGCFIFSFYINNVYGQHSFFTSLMMISFAVLVLLLVDSWIMTVIMKRRAHFVVKDVYVICTHLLYYESSSMNLHYKLARAVPLVRTIRKDLHLLLNDWYENGGEAIRRFKKRLSTDEGYSFADTLEALRMNESSAYYELLRQRIADYKEKIELEKESKKESFSYLLFIIAGLPIINTFRVFAYPWIMEGRKLFESLN